MRPICGYGYILSEQSKHPINTSLIFPAGATQKHIAQKHRKALPDWRLQRQAFTMFFRIRFGKTQTNLCNFAFASSLVSGSSLSRTSEGVVVAARVLAERKPIAERKVNSPDSRSSKKSAKAAWAKSSSPAALTMDRIVALKILLPKLASNESFKERFFREARFSAKLNHPNIIKRHRLRR